jgi:hypothetical protein
MEFQEAVKRNYFRLRLWGQMWSRLFTQQSGPTLHYPLDYIFPSAMYAKSLGIRFGNYGDSSSHWPLLYTVLTLLHTYVQYSR